MLNRALASYLTETLGVTPQIEPWTAGGKVPYTLRDQFELATATLLGQRILLAGQKGRTQATTAELRNRLRRLETLAGMPVAYVTERMAAFERGRLIAHKVPFIVPGNQLYLPDLGIDLREHFRRIRQKAPGRLSPSTQALLIRQLLTTPWPAEWRPAELAKELGYTAMTASRAVVELTEAALVLVHAVGREKRLQPRYGPRKTWEAARPLMHSPVLRRFWVEPADEAKLPGSPLAGLSALANRTTLADAGWPTRALSIRDWKATRVCGVQLFTEARPEGPAWEVWSYGPLVRAGSTEVDPLSLTMSLQSEGDERIQAALDELAEQFPW